MQPELPKTSPRPEGARRRFGVGGRLRAAFLATSVLVIFAAGASMVSFLRVDRALKAITDDNVPLVIASVDLARQAERIVAAAPALLGVSSRERQAMLSSELNREVERLHVALEQIARSDIDPAAVDSIRRAADQVRETLGALDRVVSARLAIRQQQELQLADAAAAVQSLEAILAGDARTATTPAATGPPQAGVAPTLSLELRSARSDAALLLARLKEVAVAADEAAVATLESQAQATFGDLERQALALRGALRLAYLQGLGQVRPFVDGGSAVGRTRMLELQMVAAGAKALEENAGLSQRFAAAVDRLVASVKSRIVDASTIARASQQRTALILLSVVALTLIGSFLIVWLYVQRNVIARITGLSASMKSIAAGNLEVPLPPVGSDEIGEMAQALAVFRDTAVEVRRSNLLEVQAARRRLDDAIGSIQEGFALFDSEDRLLLSNSHYRELLFDNEGVPEAGERYEAILRRSLERGLIRGVEPADREAWLQARLALHRRGEGMHQQQRSSGRWLRITEHKTGDGGTVAIYADITEIKQHEQELDEMVSQLRAANEAKSIFLANVSHELRTPLAAILGFARIVQKRLETIVFGAVADDSPRTRRAVEQVRENLGIVLIEGDRLTKLVNQVLDLEKIEAGEMVWNIGPLDVEAVLQQASAVTESLYRQKGLAFAIEVEADLPPVRGDHDRVIQVLVNLISNAVKFTDHGAVSCRARREGTDAVAISVTDTGRGIAPEDQAAVFEKFRQVGDTLTDKPSGTGLGLPISREIVTHLGGRIGVTSTVGQGCTFTFSLPLADAQAEIR